MADANPWQLAQGQPIDMSIMNSVKNPKKGPMEERQDSVWGNLGSKLRQAYESAKQAVISGHISHEDASKAISMVNPKPAGPLDMNGPQPAPGPMPSGSRLMPTGAPPQAQGWHAPMASGQDPRSMPPNPVLAKLAQKVQAARAPAPAAAMAKVPVALATQSKTLNPAPAPSATQVPVDPDSQVGGVTSTAQQFDQGTKGLSKDTAVELKNDASTELDNTLKNGLLTKRNVNHQNYIGEDQYRINSDQSRGVTHPTIGHRPLLDSEGNPKYQILGYNQKTGEPLFALDADKNKIPLLDDNSPIKDFSKDIVDPNDPTQVQERGLAKLHELLGFEAEANSKRDTTNLAPLAGLVDQMWRERGIQSDQAANYKAPESRTEKFNAFADELQKRQGDIQKARWELMKTMKGGSTQDLTQQIADRLEAQKQIDKSIEDYKKGGNSNNNRAALSQQTAFLNRYSREAKDLRSQDDVLAKVSKLLASYNPSADPETKTQLARIIEGTVRPQLAVIGQAGGDQSWWQQMLNTAQKIQNGKLTPEQRGQYMKEIRDLSAVHNNTASAMRNSWAIQNKNLERPFSDADLAGIVGSATPNAGAAGSALKSIPAPKNVGRPKSEGQSQAQKVTGAPAQAHPKDLEAEMRKRGFIK